MSDSKTEVDKLSERKLSCRELARYIWDRAQNSPACFEQDIARLIGNERKRAVERSTPVRCDGEVERGTLLLAKRALEQAQDCILGEAPPDITRKQAREDTLDKIQKVLDAIEPVHTCDSQYVMRELPDPGCGACTWIWGDRLSDLPESK